MFTINNKKQFILFLKYCFICFILLTTSCNETGCIDADDYGEYQNQTLAVYASTADNKCKFDISKAINDLKSQGTGMLTCLSTEVYTDSTSVTYKGCSKIKAYDDKISCFNICNQKCQQDTMSNSLSLEPSWVATTAPAESSESSITLSPDSEIYIQARGNISLGQEITTPYFAVESKAYVYDTIKLVSNPTSTYAKYFFDYNQDNPLSVKFYGTWRDVADSVPDFNSDRDLGPGTLSFTVPSVGNNINNTDKNIYNGIKRIFVYGIPHPVNYNIENECKGVIPNGSVNNEFNCTLGSPLLADPRVWECTYPSGSNVVTASCLNSVNNIRDYRAFYSSSTLTSAQINEIFPVSNNIYHEKLGYIGGFIRANNDSSINKTNFDPFSLRSVTCDSSGNCNTENVNSESEGRMIGDIATTDLTIRNNASRTPYAKRAYFKLLRADNSCNINLSVKQKSPRYSNFNTIKTIPISSSGWSSSFIDLEKGEEIVINRNTTNSTFGINCGKFIAIKFIKYSDIEIKQSGFVKFSNISSSSSCFLKGRIINPLASDLDFFEYDDFETATASSIDPIANLNVSGSLNANLMSWSNEVFLRKGQKIRISPETWDQTIATNASSTAQCGVGMAMQITPRPALLCRGTGSELINKPGCIPDVDANDLVIGCKAYSLNCEDQSSGSYCPEASACQFKIENCVNGSSTTAKTLCSISTQTKGSCSYTADITIAKCSSCASLQLLASTDVPQYRVEGVELCYDLENYNGAVKSIPSGSTSAIISDSLSSKGLSFLKGFDGKYGSLAPFYVTKETNGSQKIYQSQNPLLLNESSRLIFGYLDGVDFKKTISSSSNNSLSMNFKIGTSLNFTNGQWMEIKLCNQTETGCENSNPTQISGQLNVVTNENPNNDVDRQFPNYSQGYYKFDNDGNLYRFKPARAEDCIANSVITELGSLFYCHTHRSITANDLNILSNQNKELRNNEINKIRLSFKIKDPELRNCYTNKPAGSAGALYDGVQTPYDGILIENFDYDVSNNDADYCETKSYLNSDKRCRKRFVCINTYANNSGKYDVMVKIKSNKSNNISKIIGNIIEPVSKIMDGYRNGDTEVMGEAERIYRGIIGHNIYQLIVKLAIVIMFMFYGVGYLMGVSELSQSELMNRVFKIGMIYLFTGETGWEWFKTIVVQLFRDGIDFLMFSMVENFDNSPEIRMAIQNNNYDNKALIFNGVDKVFNILLSEPIGKKISALLFSGFFGWAYILILYFSIFKYVYAIATALMIFLTAKFFISILFIAGPIMILFTLFNQTKDLFDRWLKFMIAFSLQQVMVATVLAFFNILLYEVIKIVFNFRICWEEIWVIKLPLLRISLLSFWTVSNTPKTAMVQSGGYVLGGSQYIPSLFSILFIWLIASLMKKMITYMEGLASTMSGGLSSSTLGSGLAKAANQLKNSAKGFAMKYGGKALKKVGLDNVTSRMDSMLFDSGKIAKEGRANKRAEMTRDNISTKEMKKAGDQAVENHKNENASSLAKMSPEERQKALSDVRSNAMKDKGTELGLSDKKIDKFMDKGKDFKTTTDNALMALAKRASHGIMKSNKALGKNDVNTSLSYDNLKNASKDMNTQQKQELISDLRGNAGIKSDEKNALDRFENEFKKDQSKNQSEK